MAAWLLRLPDVPVLAELRRRGAPDLLAGGSQRI